MDARLRHATSESELTRRWTAARAAMKAHDLDVLVVQGTTNLSGGGYYRWLTDASAPPSNPRTVIFPLDGLMTIVEQGPEGTVRTVDAKTPPNRGIGKRCATTSYPSVIQTAHYDAEIVAREIRAAGFRRIGLVAAMATHHMFAEKLKELLAGIPIVEATSIIDPLKSVKSAEEIACVRTTAALQDAVMREVQAHLRPGMRDFEVAAFVQYRARMLGSDQVVVLCSSAPPGKPAGNRPPPEQGRTMEKGDSFSLLLEGTGPGGYFTEVTRLYVLGRATDEQRDAHGFAVEAQADTIKRLARGTSAREVWEAYVAFMKSRGRPHDTRLFSHGQGLDLVERPLIRHDEDMVLDDGMVISCHPGHVTPAMWSGIGDTFLLTSGGVERLHATPQEIIEVT
jgi:Xaa-Pro aminopeptidase